MLIVHRLKVPGHIWNQACSESWELHERSGRQSNGLEPSPSFTAPGRPLDLNFLTPAAPALPYPTHVGLGRNTGDHPLIYEEIKIRLGRWFTQPHSMEVVKLGLGPSSFDCLPLLSSNSQDSACARFQMCLCTFSLCSFSINLLKLHFWQSSFILLWVLKYAQVCLSIITRAFLWVLRCLWLVRDVCLRVIE